MSDVTVIGARGTNDGPTINPNSLPAYAKDQITAWAPPYSTYGQLVTANPATFSLDPLSTQPFRRKGMSTFLQNVG